MIDVWKLGTLAFLSFYALVALILGIRAFRASSAPAPAPERPPGACGIRACPNLRPHSHVEDLARRMRGQ